MQTYTAATKAPMTTAPYVRSSSPMAAADAYDRRGAGRRGKSEAKGAKEIEDLIMPAPTAELPSRKRSSSWRSSRMEDEARLRPHFIRPFERRRSYTGQVLPGKRHHSSTILLTRHAAQAHGMDMHLAGWHICWDGRQRLRKVEELACSHTDPHASLHRANWLSVSR